MFRCCGEGINVFKGDEKNNGLQKFCKAALEPVVISNYKSALCHEYGSGKILAFGSRRDLYKVFRCGSLMGSAVMRIWNAIILILVYKQKVQAVLAACTFCLTKHYFIQGMRMINWVSSPFWLWADIVPPIASIRPRLIDKPRPLPPEERLRDLSAR